MVGNVSVGKSALWVLAMLPHRLQPCKKAGEWVYKFMHALIIFSNIVSYCIVSVKI